MELSNPVDRTEVAGLPGIDLVRLSLVLVGATRSEEALTESLRVLGESAPGIFWGILHRIGARKYRAVCDPGVGCGDIRLLADRSCGDRSWLSVGSPVATGKRDHPPRWYAIQESRNGRLDEPVLVLGYWARNRRAEPPKLDDLCLETAARLIASAASSADVFEYLLEQSSRDPLTGLLNRRGIFDVLARERARADRTATPLSVLFLDLDRFKEINDTLGHRVGDDVLSAVAGSLSHGLRASDAVGRIGGDEFLIVLPDTDLSRAWRIGSRLVRDLGLTPIAVPGGTLEIKLSCGAASLDEPLRPADLVEMADRRMMRSKRRRQRAESPAPPVGRERIESSPW